MKIIIANSRKWGPQEVFVDDEDYNKLLMFSWTASKHPSSRTFYAVRAHKFYNDNGDIKKTTIKMHRVIMCSTQYEEVDHIDHNGLNNQKHNLRNGSHADNLKNVISQLNSTSKFIGVCWDKNSNKWMAKIKINKKTINLGRYSIEFDAAKAYDTVAKKQYGERANLNFKDL